MRIEDHAMYEAVASNSFSSSRPSGARNTSALRLRRGLAAPCLQDGLRSLAGRRVLALPVAGIGAEQHEPGVPYRRGTSAESRGQMWTPANSPRAPVAFQPGDERGMEFLRLPKQRLGPVVGRAVQVGPGGEPVAVAVLMDVAPAVGDTTERVPEGGHRLAGLDTGQTDALAADSRCHALGPRRRANVEGPDLTRRQGRVPAKVSDVLVELEGRGVRAVDILADDRLPHIGEVAGQL